MNQHATGVPAHKVGFARTALVALLAATASTAWCQAASAPGDGAPSEAARRAAQSPYRFILQHAATPARKPVEKEREKDKDNKDVAKRAPAEPPVQSAARAPAPAAPVMAAPAAPAAAAPVVVDSKPEPAPAPEPVQTAARTQPSAPPVVRREIIPVRTDEPRLSAALLRERPSGLVRVQFEIQPDGSTGAVKVMSSTNRALNRATVDAVSHWKFQPVDEILTVETEIDYKYDQ